MSPGETRFEFGKNWRDYVNKSFNQDKVEISKRHMLQFMHRKALKGFTILDIGCGSGLHSLAALQTGADSVYSFDFDAESFTATSLVKEWAGSPDNWSVKQGSILDDDFVSKMPQFDLVYAWGVLHHTGDVWHAIRNAAGRVKSGGFFYMALYSADVQIDPPPKFWLDIKKKYISSGKLYRRVMEIWYIWRFQLHRNIFRLPLFLKAMINYRKNRGMKPEE
ncbi:MAG: class I SAM-dependent methyltransferase, partial [Desulfobacterales bacterium]